ncbi:hypothetical protein BU15DRAFT_67571 [Melanogaster broomeanus]|nr:hypothetical protein BU15DRAFT_67571 [Melanogaster broomeanus]
MSRNPRQKATVIFPDVMVTMPDVPLADVFKDPRKTTVEKAMHTFRELVAAQATTSYELDPQLDPLTLTVRKIFPQGVSPHQMLPDELTVILQPSTDDCVRIESRIEKMATLEKEKSDAKAKAANKRKAKRAKKKQDMNTEFEEVEDEDVEKRGIKMMNSTLTPNTPSSSQEPFLQFVKNQERINAELRALIAKQDSKMAKQDSKIAKQDSRIAKQDTTNAEQCTVIVELEDRVVRQDAVIVQLEAKVLRQDAIIVELEAKVVRQDGALASLRAELTDKCDSLLALTRRLKPLYLRHLLNLGREEILKSLPYSSWKALCADKSVFDLPNYVFEQLGSVSDRPTLASIKELCYNTNVRNEGDHVAHNANTNEIKEAIMSKAVDSTERARLEEIYQWVFKKPIDTL